MAERAMPNFWWCPTHHLYRGGDARPCADAVKLGDVEELKRELDDSLRRYWGLRDKLADIREALVNHAAHAAPYSLLNAIHEIVERETR